MKQTARRTVAEQRLVTTLNTDWESPIQAHIPLPAPGYEWERIGTDLVLLAIVAGAFAQRL